MKIYSIEALHYMLYIVYIYFISAETSRTYLRVLNHTQWTRYLMTLHRIRALEYTNIPRFRLVLQVYVCMYNLIVRLGPTLLNTYFSKELASEEGRNIFWVFLNT